MSSGPAEAWSCPQSNRRQIVCPCQVSHIKEWVICVVGKPAVAAGSAAVEDESTEDVEEVNLLT